MARRRRTTRRRSSGGGASITALRKAEKRIDNQAQKARRETLEAQLEVSAMMGAVALGLVERFGWDVPSIPHIPDSLTYGAGLYLVGARLVRGKLGDGVRAAGVGMLACSLRDLTSGRVKIEGAGDYYDPGAFEDFYDDEAA